jgi:hypothetical protein
MIVACRRPGCDQTVHTAFPGIQPYHAPECATADRVAVVFSATPLDDNARIAIADDQLAANEIAAYVTQALNPADADSAFVAELMREAVKATSIVDSGETAGKYTRKYDSTPLTSESANPAETECPNGGHGVGQRPGVCPACRSATTGNNIHPKTTGRAPAKPYGEPVGFDEPKPDAGWLPRALRWVFG